ncbi:hypothetical protein D9757_011032 [Collybiopsis confluens]|uniref:Uncharacterized protein n=1 Tax=Collybiopsis confluens TaxID=2823264 RepID=A0A8H5LQM5_9AGAR|nr:hypothetical protein D9757_011032 [Collybiopsis confluens]
MPPESHPVPEQPPFVEYHHLLFLLSPHPVRSATHRTAVDQFGQRYTSVPGTDSARGHQARTNWPRIQPPGFQSVEGNRIEAKLDGYLAVAENQREHEKTLYDPLNEFLNAICQGLASDDLARVFNTQAYRRILGYGLDRRPDFSHIYRRYLGLKDDEDLDSFLRESWMEGMHWLHMLSFVEVKHENGRILGHGIRKRRTEAANNAKTGNNGSSTKTLPAPTSENPSLSPGFEGASTAPVTSVSPSDPEGKASALFQKTRRQVAAYGKVLFSAGAIRSHVVGLVIDERVFWFVFFCRSIVVESEPMSKPHREKIGS